jgi:hypothetical protein
MRRQPRCLTLKSSVVAVAFALVVPSVGCAPGEPEGQTDREANAQHAQSCETTNDCTPGWACVQGFCADDSCADCGRIAGHVYSHGTPAANLSIAVKETGMTTHTGPEGNYTFQLPPGQYDLLTRGRVYPITVGIAGVVRLYDLYLRTEDWNDCPDEEGLLYPKGYELDELTCQADGTWQ